MRSITVRKRKREERNNDMDQTIINPYKLFVGSFIPNWLLHRKEISNGAKLCYARLCQFAGKNGKCYPSQETIAKEVALSVRQVQRYIKELIDNDLLIQKQQGLQKPNLYYFIWHHWMNGIDDDSDLSDITSQETSDTTCQNMSVSTPEENHNKRISEVNQDDSKESSRRIFSKMRSPKRTRKSSSMKERTKQKAQRSAKKKKDDHVSHENIANTQLLEVWNKQDNLRSHKTRSSRVYKDTMRKLEALRQGTLYKSVSKDMLQSDDVPYEWFSTKWKKKDISKAIKTLNEWCKEGNYPKNKDWIKKLSLSDAVFNSRTGSPLMQAYKRGVKPLYDPHKILKSEEEQMAYDRFFKFFSEMLEKNDVKTQKQIVDLVRSLAGQRERYKNNWKRYEPEYFGYGFVPSNTFSLAIDYIEFLRGQYEDDFTPKRSLTPNGLKIGSFVWSRFEKAYVHRFGADPIKGPN